MTVVEEVQKYQDGLERYVALEGVSAKSLEAGLYALWNPKTSSFVRLNDVPLVSSTHEGLADLLNTLEARDVIQIVQVILVGKALGTEHVDMEFVPSTPEISKKVWREAAEKKNTVEVLPDIGDPYPEVFFTLCYPLRTDRKGKHLFVRVVDPMEDLHKKSTTKKPHKARRFPSADAAREAYSTVPRYFGDKFNRDEDDQDVLKICKVILVKGSDPELTFVD